MYLELHYKNNYLEATRSQLDKLSQNVKGFSKTITAHKSKDHKNAQVVKSDDIKYEY